MRLVVCVLLWGAVAVSGEDCLLSDFLKGPKYDSKFYTSGLQSSYPTGSHVRVPCVVGHSGFFKLSCEMGTWKSIGSTCKPKPCGHPGEAQNAEFSLVGEDFVFASKVVYTCNKGYKMVSRINYRRCTSEGWDGVVPVCESVQCPWIELADGTLGSRNLEETPVGSVLQFSCKSSAQVLEGPLEIFCTHTGEWSGPAPKCKVVTCPRPNVANGHVVGHDLEYPEHHVLQVNCNPKFQPSEPLPSKCTKRGLRAGWSPKPSCKPIQCEIGLSKTIGTTFEPSLSHFSVDDSVTIKCEEDYWIINPRTTTAVSTCQDNGKWSIEPKCSVVTCSNYKHNDVYWWATQYYQHRHGSRVRYQCNSGLYPTDDATELTCTRDGWRPHPPCEERTCNVADVQNAHPVDFYEKKFKYDVTILFKCWSRSGNTFRLTCTKQGWSGENPCASGGTSPVEPPPTLPQGPPPCPEPIVKNGFAVQTLRGSVYFTCHEGFQLSSGASWDVAECKNSAWEGLEHCIDQRICNNKPEVPNADVNVISGSIEHEDIAEVTCRDGNKPTISQIICQNGIWDSKGTPLQNICTKKAELCGPPPPVKDAIINTRYQDKYAWDSKVTYRCRDKFTLEGQNQIQCRVGSWEPSVINCTGYCFKPKEEQPTMKFSPDQERYLPGAVLEYQCLTPNAEKSQGSATCEQGSWSQPISCEVRPCGSPDDTTNGYYQVNQEGTTAKYYCNEGFEMVSSVDTRMCVNGNWSERIPVCEATACDLPPLDEDMTVIGWVEDRVPQGHSLSFSCKLPGKVINGSAELKCKTDGQWDNKFPTCEDVYCAVEKTGPHLQVHEPSTVRHGQKVRFTCDDKFVMDGAQEIECLPSGTWSQPLPSCSEPCGLTDLHESVQPEQLELDATIQTGDKVRFRCRVRSHFLIGSREVECLPNGKWSSNFPTCGAAAQICQTPPTLTDGDMQGSIRSAYRHLTQVEMICQSYYVMDGSPFKTCFNGEWRGDMKCLKPCTVDRDIMNQRQITFRYTRDDKLYSKHNEEIEFMCTRGQAHGSMRQRCVDGHMELPTCQ